MKLETLISDYLYHNEVDFQFEDNIFNPTLGVEKKSFLKAMTLLKEELSSFWLLDISALSGHGGPILIYHLLNIEFHCRLRVKVKCSKNREIPSLAHLWQNAYWYERELFDLFGIRAGASPSRLILPENLTGHPFQDQKSLRLPDAPFVKNTFQKQAYSNLKKTHSFGEYNSVEFLENGYFEGHVRLDGTKILATKLILGFEHRGIEKLCEGKSYIEVIPFLEKVNTSQSPLFIQLWCSLVEEIFKIEVTDRSQALRMLMSEMVRIQDHLKTFSVMIRLLGGHGYSPLLNSLYEKVYSLSRIICPEQKYFRFSCPGGLLTDIPLDWRGECLNTLATLEKELFSWEKVMLSSVTLKERLLIDGISGKDALELGLSGPALRACGINYDLRKVNPYYFYNQVDFDVPLGLNGSSYDRFLVRLEEVKQSIRIIYQLLNNLPMGETLSSELSFLANQDSLAAWAGFFKGKSLLGQEIYFFQEGPNGELGYYLNVDDKNKINRLKIHTSSFHHAQAYEKLIVGFDIEDAPLVQSSLNFSIAEIER